jgi:hypothetical protein
MKHQILAFAVAALCFTACTNEDNISQDFLADTPIKLNVSVDEPTTRAGYSSTELPEGFLLAVYHILEDQTVDKKYSYEVWAKKVGDSWKTYKFNKETNSVTDEEVTMLWANMKDKVSVAAFTNLGDITIPTAQTSDDQLKQADVLYMPTADCYPKLCKDGINVNLQHAMSKINLTIELGSEYEFSKEDVDLKIKDVKIDGSLVSATVYANGIYDEFGVPTPIFPFHTGTTPYSKTNGVITKASATYEAILIPQDIASGNFTVSFKVEGKLYEWAYNNEAGLTLAPNTAYTLKLIAGDDKVQPASFSVAEWGKGNGDGENKETD